MMELKDPKIKLFGKTIATAGAPAAVGGSVGAQFSVTAGEDDSKQDPSCSSDSVLEDRNLNGEADEYESLQSLWMQDQSEKEDRVSPLTSEELKDSYTTPRKNQDSNATSTDIDVVVAKASSPEEEQSETGNSQEKNLKKPDKILPCPRCNSMETKFCYFNNYNVNQPRHFCKNCQRYWTAGGTMRNVPVGAGRRKNKNSISQFRRLTVPEALPNGIHHSALNHDGTVLTFGSDSPLCESIASVLNIAGKTVRHEEDRGDCFSISSVGDAELGKTGLRETMPNCHPFPPQVPCFPGAAWPYPWNSVQWSSPVSPPGFGPTCFPVPFVSPAQPYWGCTVPGTWNVPLIISSDQQPHTSPSSSPNSPTLGKHSRDDNSLKLPSTKEEDVLKECNSDKSLWAPKTLRIDDPGEAAKSSIWATLGRKNDKADSVVVGGGLFKAFRSKSKSDENTCAPETPSVLQANPAALSRSLSFHESS